MSVGLLCSTGSRPTSKAGMGTNGDGMGTAWGHERNEGRKGCGVVCVAFAIKRREKCPEGDLRARAAMQAPQSTPSTPLGACGTWGPPPGRCNGSQPPWAVTGVTKRPQRGLGRTPVTHLVAHHMATPCAPPQPHSTPRPRWAMGAGPVAHQKPQCGLTGSGWPQGSVTRSQPTDLGPGGTWAAPATAFVIRCFQLFWLLQPRCRVRLKWSEVVSTVEKTFGHLKSSRR